MAEPVKVVKLSDLREEFHKYYLDHFVKKVIEETDKRYFTRNKIYLFLIFALVSIITFAWHNTKMFYEIQELPKSTIIKEKPG